MEQEPEPIDIETVILQPTGSLVARLNTIEEVNAANAVYDEDRREDLRLSRVRPPANPLVVHREKPPESS